MSKTRAIRFSDKEEQQIEEFLAANPVFDFSSFARTAILAFMKNPKLQLRPIEKPKGASSSERQQWKI